MANNRDITIYDIAKHLNISAATVSRGLKNNPIISKNTRKKIAETAKALGYQTNTFASSLRSRRTHTLGVLVPRLNSYFMSSVLAGMEKAASKYGYNLIIAQSLEDEEKEKINAATMYNKRVDGLLISLSNNSKNIQHLEPFFKRKIPVVFFDRFQAHKESTSVAIDNYRAAYEMTKHLIDQGSKRIMHLGGPILRNVYKDRLAGYKAALADHGLIFRDYLHQISDLSEQAGIEAARNIMELDPKKRPDAVFSANDTAAAFCMITLKDAGIRIPEQIAFAGFNNDPISKVVDPKLTTVDYSGESIGNTAVSNLINHLKGLTDLKTTNLITLKSDLILRGSSLRITSKKNK
jgi:LacI family transcriptional regulator